MAPNRTSTTSIRIPNSARQRQRVIHIRRMRTNVNSNPTGQRLGVEGNNTQFRNPNTTIRHNFHQTMSIIRARNKRSYLRLSHRFNNRFPTATRRINRTTTRTSIDRFRGLLRRHQSGLSRDSLLFVRLLHRMNQFTVTIQTHRRRTRTSNRQPRRFPRQAIRARQNFLRRHTILTVQSRLQAPRRRIIRATVFGRRTLQHANQAENMGRMHRIQHIRTQRL